MENKGNQDSTIVHFYDLLHESEDQPHEWWEIDKVLKSFFLASSLQVNGTQTTILQEGMMEHELMPYKSLFPYIFYDLEYGFKYLGYFLKTRSQ
jgi:hypothetical protein